MIKMQTKNSFLPANNVCSANKVYTYLLRACNVKEKVQEKL